MLLVSASMALADSVANDWVSINYALKQAGGSASQDTASARQGIISSAGSTAKSGPWTVVDKGSVSPPSGNPQDYLSWAPYHWPACNWCTKGTTHLSNPGSSGNDTGDDSDDGTDGADPDDSDPYEDGGSDDGGDDGDETLIVIRDHHSAFSRRRRGVFGSHRHMRRLRRAALQPLVQVRDASIQDAQANAPISGSPIAQLAGLDDVPTSLLPTVPTPLPSVSVPQSPLSGPGSSSSGSIGTMAGTPAPAEAPAKTSSPKSSGSCTPSPTKSLAPSATWTTCPYEVRDGKVNPDVSTLPDSPAVVHMTESVLYNSLAYVMQKTGSYSKNAASFIDAFFLSPSTGMRPNMNFGQMVRGPGQDHQIGTFTGVLDLRFLVKVVNSVQLLKAAGSPDWTSARDQALTSWMNQYSSWLQTSDLGKQVASKANNHYTFYVNQLAAAKMYVGDTKGATAALQSYFSNQYLDQIAASGEQPFEAVRTRPYHYRCFNLEAMITNAKLGDQLGTNFWSAKSKYGATIQTALDYTMGLDPKGEDVSDIFPHVAAVAAAYGDPSGKYAAFLQKQVSSYKSMPFWFYDQTSALPNSPAAHSTQKRADMDKAFAAAEDIKEMMVNTVLKASQIPFECPAVFTLGPETELDDGIFVTCKQVEPFYEIQIPLNSSAIAM